MTRPGVDEVPPVVSAAIAQLYRIFGEGPLDRPLAGCEDCADPGELRLWSGSPLRELSGLDLLRYLSAAMSTIGDEEDFTHFVPRLFELAATNPYSIDLAQLGSQLHRADWQGWPGAERDAVGQMLEATWTGLLQHEYTEPHVDDVVCALALARVEMTGRLHQWASVNDPSGVANLRRFMERNRPTLRETRRLSNAFWDESPTQEVLVADWLRATMKVY